jgi:hypothetical protein
MRGHKFSLVWMGWTIPELRALRSAAIGTERSLRLPSTGDLKRIEQSAVVKAIDEHRIGAIIQRYIADCALLMSNMKASLAASGNLIMVVADSNVRGYTVNSKALFEQLGALHGLRLTASDIRSIPSAHRYLPMSGGGNIANRMKTEWVLQFVA